MARRKNKRELKNVMTMTGDEFERHVCAILHDMGYDDAEVRGARTARTQGDLGLDVVADENRLVVQCKRYNLNNKVSPREVREFRGAMAGHRNRHNLQNVTGWFVTTSDYTDNALDEFADDGTIELYTYADLLEKHREHWHAEVNRLQGGVEQQKQLSKQLSLEKEKLEAQIEQLEQLVEDPAYLRNILVQKEQLEQQIAQYKATEAQTRRRWHGVPVWAAAFLLLLCNACFVFSYADYTDSKIVQRAAQLATTTTKSQPSATVTLKSTLPLPTVTPTPYAVLVIQYRTYMPQDTDWNKYNVTPGRIDTYTLQVLVDPTQAYTIGRTIINNEPNIAEITLYMPGEERAE